MQPPSPQRRTAGLEEPAVQGQVRGRGTRAGRAPLPAARHLLPQVGTSSSADEVCSSVDGFFFPKPMILVIFFPVTLDTVPLFSDLELFFLLTVKNNDGNETQVSITDLDWKE